MSKRWPVEMSSVREAELTWKYQQLKQLRKMLQQAEISRTARHGHDGLVGSIKRSVRGPRKYVLQKKVPLSLCIVGPIVLGRVQFCAGTEPFETMSGVEKLFLILPVGL